MKSKYNFLLLKMNIKLIQNLCIGIVMVCLALINRDVDYDYFTPILVAMIILNKILQNYLICCFEGDIRGR